MLDISLICSDAEVIRTQSEVTRFHGNSMARHVTSVSVQREWVKWIWSDVRHTHTHTSSQPEQSLHTTDKYSLNTCKTLVSVENSYHFLFWDKHPLGLSCMTENTHNLSTTTYDHIREDQTGVGL